MSDTPDVGPILRTLRAERGWTLDDLAGHSDVSRSMVSQIERGEANPTFATLWNLTQALGVEIQDLTSRAAAQTPAQIALLSPAQTPVMHVDDNDIVLRILSPVDLADIAEWYELTVQPGGALVSAPHAVGTMEHLTVLDGGLAVRTGDATVEVTTGSTARYQADGEHEIRNNGTKPARAVLVVITRSVK